MEYKTMLNIGKYSASSILRDPDSFIGKKVKYSGSLYSTRNDGDIADALCSMEGRNTIYFSCKKEVLNGKRLVDQDYVTLRGTIASTYSYADVKGARREVPYIEVDSISMKGSKDLVYVKTILITTVIALIFIFGSGTIMLNLL